MPPLRKMVNKDMNGFPVKKCSAFQFFKKRVRRWIKSPMVSMEKHQTSSLKYPGSTVMHIPQGEPDIESPLCQMCFSDHAFQREIVPPDTESCSWEGHRSCNMKELYNKEDPLAQPDQSAYWANDNSVLPPLMSVESTDSSRAIELLVDPVTPKGAFSNGIAGM